MQNLWELNLRRSCSSAGIPGVVHGSLSYLLQDEWGQVLEAESISAGLDYPGIGPEHAHLAETGRARYEKVSDKEVVEAFQLLSRTEGIIPALEPAHALAWMSREREYLSVKLFCLTSPDAGQGCDTNDGSPWMTLREEGIENTLLR